MAPAPWGPQGPSRSHGRMGKHAWEGRALCRAVMQAGSALAWAPLCRPGHASPRPARLHALGSARAASPCASSALLSVSCCSSPGPALGRGETWEAVGEGALFMVRATPPGVHPPHLSSPHGRLMASSGQGQSRGHVIAWFVYTSSLTRSSWPPPRPAHTCDVWSDPLSGVLSPGIISPGPAPSSR